MTDLVDYASAFAITIAIFAFVVLIMSIFNPASRSSCVEYGVGYFNQSIEHCFYNGEYKKVDGVYYVNVKCMYDYLNNYWEYNAEIDAIN